MKKRGLKGILLRIIAVLITLGVLSAAAVAGISIYVCTVADKYIITPQEALELQDADCAVILGCAVWAGNQPSPMLEDRLNGGIALYESGAVPKIIVSGDHGREYYDEVGVMRDWCLAAGVPSEDIFSDHAGFSTYESAVRAAKVFGVKRCVVVTQSFHLTRAVTLLRAQGIEAYGVPSDLRPYKNHYYNEIRELGARVKDLFYMIFRPAPTYLGEPIDIGGSGTVTFD